MEVIPSRFAEMCMVSPAAISKKIKSGTLILNSGGKLDTDNPINRQYLTKKQARFQADISAGNLEAAASKPGFDLAAQSAGVMPELAAATTHVSDSRNKDTFTTHVSDKNRTVRNGADSMQISGAANEALNMTLRELIIKRGGGTIDGVEKYSKILRDLVTADEKDQKLQERRLLQVPKDFVVSRLFDFVDQLMNKLLDVPESITDQVIAYVQAGGDTMRQNVINLISDNLSRCIAGTKEHIISELNGLKGKYDKQDASIDDAVSEIIKEQLEG